MNAEKSSTQLLKTRDDHSLISLETDETAQAEPSFRLSDGFDAAWTKPDQTVRPAQLRARIEPWLSALFQSEHLSLLVGYGLTHGIHRMATNQALSGMNTVGFGNFSDAITARAKELAQIADRGVGNVEDEFRAALDLLNGLETLAGHSDFGIDRSHADVLRGELVKAMSNFALSILEGESGLATSGVDKRTSAFDYLVSFLMSFASRTGTRERLHIFTTNYDRYIEIGADVAGLRLIDRFVGTLAPLFRASRLDIDIHYNPPGIIGEPRYLEGVARFTKLHGSVDWVEDDGEIRRVGVPFGVTDVNSYLAPTGLQPLDALGLMIYPNASKDRETTLYPYAELFRDFAAAVCRPNSTLVTYGYSFGDDHINRVIKDMLTIPSTHLVVISYDDRLRRIISTYEQLGRHSQWTLMVGNHLGDLRFLVDNYLPKPAIDRTTIRMADLLKSRMVDREMANENSNDTAHDGFEDS